MFLAWLHEEPTAEFQKQTEHKVYVAVNFLSQIIVYFSLFHYRTQKQKKNKKHIHVTGQI